MKTETIFTWIIWGGIIVFITLCLRYCGKVTRTGIFNPPIEIRNCTEGFLSDDIDILNTSDNTLICRAYIGRGSRKSTEYFKIGPYQNFNLWIGKANEVRIDVEGYSIDLVFTQYPNEGKYSWRYD